MSPEETPEEQPEKRRRRRRKEAADVAPATEATAGTPEATEATPPDAAPRSDEPVAAADDETTPGASSADATPEAPADEEQEPEDADEDEEDDEDEEEEDEVEELEAEAPAATPRRRRPGSRKPAVEEKPAAPTRRRREVPAGPPPVVRAQAKYVRSSSRKARLVCDHIRGKSVEEARAILAHTPRAIARDWSKLLESAVANAEHNHELVGEDLYVKAVHADEGPTIKRFRPRAMGRATKIRKRTSHLTILLTPKDNRN
jgi:ribosomal protein L22